MKAEWCYCSSLSKMSEVFCRKTHMHPKGRAYPWRQSPHTGWAGWKQQPAARLPWERDVPLLHKNLNSKILDDWSHQMPLRVCPPTGSLAKDFLGVLGPGNGKHWKALEVQDSFPTGKSLWGFGWRPKPSAATLQTINSNRGTDHTSRKI